MRGRPHTGRLVQWFSSIGHSAFRSIQNLLTKHTSNLLNSQKPREGATPMKKTIQLVLVLASALAAVAQTSTTPQAATTTVASVVDAEISTIEKQVVEAAEAMPEDKFNFSPEGLNIAGSDFKGVRTFAVQVKHIATSNYFIWW